MGITLIDDERPADDWEELMLDLREAQRAEDDAKAHKKKIQDQIMERLRTTQFKSHTVQSSSDPTKDYRAVYVANRRLKVDEVGLKKALTAKAWRTISKTILDKEALDIAVGDPENPLTADDVQPFITITESPYVRLYEMEHRDEEAVDDRPTDAD